MTIEERKLLLKDLCYRSPYNVIIYIIGIGIEVLNYIDLEDEFVNCAPLETIRPYLRSMSNMTEKEKEELYHYYCNEIADNLNTPNLTWELRCCVSNSFGTDWLNAHHFDYSGLIEKGLAIEAPKGMYVL